MIGQTTGKISCIKSHPNHPNLFAVGTSSNSVLLFDARIGGAYARLAGPSVLGAAIDIHGDLLATGSYRSSDEMELFSFSQQTALTSFDFNKIKSDHHGFVMATKFSSCGGYIFAGGAGQNEFKIFRNDLLRGQQFELELSLTNFEDAINQIATSRHQNRVCVGLLNGDVFPFSYAATENDDSEPLKTVAELVDIQKSRCRQTQAARLEIGRRLSPFDPLRYKF